MKKIAISSLIVLAALLAWLFWPRHLRDNAVAPGGGPSARQPLVVYCAVALRQPVEAAAKAFEAAGGPPAQLQFGGSQTLLSNAKVSGKGDLYIPADATYVDTARLQQLVDRVVPLAEMHLVVGVQKGNPKKIHSLDDLLRPDVRLGLADPAAAAAGKVAKEWLVKLKRWDEIQGRLRVTKPTVDDVRTDLQIGTIDASFVWDSTVRQSPGHLEALDLPELVGQRTALAAASLKTSTHPVEANQFLDFLSSDRGGRSAFRAAGFVVTDAADLASTRPATLPGEPLSPVTPTAAEGR